MGAALSRLAASVGATRNNVAMMNAQPVSSILQQGQATLLSADGPRAKVIHFDAANVSQRQYLNAGLDITGQCPEKVFQRDRRDI